MLTSGGGNDRLIGGSGSDQYAYAAGGGDDRIVEAGAATDIDRLSFGTGISASDIVVGRSSFSNTDVVLHLAGGTIILQDQLSDVAGAGIEEIHFPTRRCGHAPTSWHISSRSFSWAPPEVTAWSAA